MTFRRILLILISIFFFLCLSASFIAAKDDIILEGGYIEWGDGYMSATDGFNLWIDDNYITGHELYLDIDAEEYQLDEAAFTVCKLDHPHYLIHAKEIRLNAGEKLVLSGAKIQIGNGLVIPIPFALVLKYRNGRYQFPDWLPKLVFSLQDGVGVEFNMSHIFSRSFSMGGRLLWMSKGKTELDLHAKYLLGYDLVFTGDIAYDHDWEYNLGLDWRKGKEGLRGSIDWNFAGEKEESNLGISYLLKGYQSKFSLNQIDNQTTKIFLSISTPKYHLYGIDNKAGLEYISDKVNDNDYIKAHVNSIIRKQYKVDSLQLGWSFQPTQYWIEDIGFSGKYKANLWVEASITENTNIRLGYGKTARWGEGTPDSLINYSAAEFIEGKITYHTRNTLDEGWDFELAGKYDLITDKFSEAMSKVVKAYDCFDVELKIDILDEIFDLGIQLKY